MRIVKQKRADGFEFFKLRLWRKKVFVRGLHGELKIGNRAWRLYPSKKEEARQLAEARARGERQAKSA